MLDESVILGILCEEIGSETDLPANAIHQDSLLSQDLDLYDEELERVLLEASCRLMCPEIDPKDTVNCSTVRDLLDVLLFAVYGDDQDD